MNSQIFAGIDPGGSTGLAIAKVTFDFQTVGIYLQQVVCNTFKSPAAVCETIRVAKVEYVFMEKRAKHPHSKEGLEPYQQILFGLETMGFHRTPTPRVETQGITLITPGLWKPFMEKITPPDRRTWQIDTQHEKDAVNLLHYGLQVNYLTLKVYYE